MYIYTFNTVECTFYFHIYPYTYFFGVDAVSGTREILYMLIYVCMWGLMSGLLMRFGPNF